MLSGRTALDAEGPVILTPLAVAIERALASSNMASRELDVDSVAM